MATRRPTSLCSCAELGVFDIFIIFFSTRLDLIHTFVNMADDRAHHGHGQGGSLSGAWWYVQENFSCRGEGSRHPRHRQRRSLAFPQLLWEASATNRGADFPTFTVVQRHPHDNSYRRRSPFAQNTTEPWKFPCRLIGTSPDRSQAASSEL